MPDLITITETLRLVRSLDEFRGPNGKAILKTPYFRKLEDGTLLFEFIWNDTDPRQLQEFIARGSIYKPVELNVSNEGTGADRTGECTGELCSEKPDNDKSEEGNRA